MTLWTAHGIEKLMPYQVVLVGEIYYQSRDELVGLDVEAS
jgi:hypothetical protein